MGKQQISVEVDEEDLKFKLDNRLKWNFLIKEGIKSIKGRNDIEDINHPAKLRINIEKMQVKLRELSTRIYELEQKQ